MAIRVVDFLNGGTKLERFLPKNQHTQRKLLNIEFWINGELSIISFGYVDFFKAKLERFLLKNQHTQRKLLNFVNWVNGEVSKIEHHFSK